MGLLIALSKMGIGWSDLQNENVRPFLKSDCDFQDGSSRALDQLRVHVSDRPCLSNGGSSTPIRLASPCTQLIDGSYGTGLGIFNYWYSALSTMVVIELYLVVTWQSMKPMTIIKEIIPKGGKKFIFYSTSILQNCKPVPTELQKCSDLNVLVNGVLYKNKYWETVLIQGQPLWFT